MEHLSLEIFDLQGKGSQYANLPEDASITFTDTSEVFSSGDVWSHSFTLNVYANAEIFGTSGDMHGGRLHEQLNGRRARLWVDGLPLYLGYLKLDDEVDVDEDGNVDVTFESGQKTFDELIEGGKANQVPMMSDIMIGMALWRKRWTCVEAKIEATAVFEDGSRSNTNVLTHEVHESVVGDEDSNLTYLISDGEDDGTSVQQYPRMVYPKGTFYNVNTGKEETFNCLNTDSPYDASHPYCNTALCYQKYGYTVTKEENGTKTTYDDYTAEPTAQRGYEVMPANRVNSAPNFYVIYWVKALMNHLDIHIDEDQMENVEDLRRLFFVNTSCSYEEPQYLRNPDKYDGAYGKYEFGDAGPLLAEYLGDYDKKQKRWKGIEKISKPNDCSFDCESFAVKDNDRLEDLFGCKIKKLEIKVKSIVGMSDNVRAYYDGSGHDWFGKKNNNPGKQQYGRNRNLQKNFLLHKAIASSECFPNVDISEVISALKNGFGIRFLFDENYKRVRIVLLRNIFRSKEVQNVTCDILKEEKEENSIRGFKLTYGDSDDTQFKYKGFDDLLPHKKELWIDKSDKHDYSRWDLNAQYQNIIHRISAFDVTCYVTPNTGNSYGIKVDKDAKKYDDLHPSLFEYAGYMDAEDGDCSGEDETIETVNVGFKPAIMNDCNFEKERDENIRDQRYALFVDEQMKARRPDLEDLKAPKTYDDSDAVYDIDKLYELHGNKGTKAHMVSDGVVTPGSFCVASDMYTKQGSLNVLLWKNTMWDTNFAFNLTDIKIAGHINEGYRLYLQDNFEPNDDGICPVETHDWGLTLGIMRGSGSDAYVNYTGDPDDEEGNDTWDVVPGSNATAHPDTCDSYGNLWDYNGGTKYMTAEDAIAAMPKLWPDSNVDLIHSNGTTLRTSKNYIVMTVIRYTKDSTGDTVALMFETLLADGTKTYKGTTTELQFYAKRMEGMTKEQMFAYDKENHNILIEYKSSNERASTILALQRLAFNNGPAVYIDNGVGIKNGRFSLKLRAEKLNPYYVKGSTDPKTKDQYLSIDNDNLKGRGLMDQFYKEYSYWVRNSRIAKLTVNMELAQFLAIDKTKRVKIGSYQGFIKKMEFTVSNKTGLGMVTIELMYI